MHPLVSAAAAQETPLLARSLQACSASSVASSIVPFFKRMDQAMAAVSPMLACENGCSYCCYYHVYVYPVEVLALAQFIKRLDGPKQRVITERLVANVAEVASMTVMEHIVTNIRCALLDDSGKCVAYALRPVACRKFHSITGVPCKVTFEDTKSSMLPSYSEKREAIGTGFMKALVDGARLAGVDTTQYEMSAALLEALSNPACAKRWKSGKTTFPSVGDKASGLL